LIHCAQPKNRDFLFFLNNYFKDQVLIGVLIVIKEE
jgi:hypothetical protein